MAKVDLSQYGITGTTEVVYNPSYEDLFAEETKPELEGYEKGQVTQAIQSSQASQSVQSTLTFRSDSLREEHFEKHGIEMGFASAKEYDKAAAAVVADSRALHKLEKEDNDDVYYIKETNEFVIVSTDGYIRTYFYPRDGIEYFERQ